MKNIIKVTLIKALYAIDTLNYKIRLKVSKDSQETDVLRVMSEKEKRREVCEALARNDNSDGETLDKLFSNSHSSLWADIGIIENPNVKRITLVKLSMSSAQMVSDEAKDKLGQCERDDVTVTK